MSGSGGVLAGSATTGVQPAPISLPGNSSVGAFQAGSSRGTAGPEKTFLRGPETFLRDPAGEKFFEFFFTKWCILAYFINFWPTAGPPNVAGPGVINPLFHPLDGPACRRRYLTLGLTVVCPPASLKYGFRCPVSNPSPFSRQRRCQSTSQA